MSTRSLARSAARAILSAKAAISRHESLQHVRDQRRRIDFFVIGLRMQRGVAIKIGFQTDGARSVSRQSAYSRLSTGREWRPSPVIHDSCQP
jgi:hypothetical protein